MASPSDGNGDCVRACTVMVGEIRRYHKFAPSIRLFQSMSDMAIYRQLTFSSLFGGNEQWWILPTMENSGMNPSRSWEHRGTPAPWSPNRRCYWSLPTRRIRLLYFQVHGGGSIWVTR